MGEENEENHEEVRFHVIQNSWPKIVKSVLH